MLKALTNMLKDDILHKVFVIWRLIREVVSHMGRERCSALPGERSWDKVTG